MRFGVTPHPGFKSRSLRAGVADIRSAAAETTEQAPVAQRIEHLTTDQKVRGSNPFGRATLTLSVNSANGDDKTISILTKSITIHGLIHEAW